MYRWICLALLCTGCAAHIPGEYVTRPGNARATLTVREDGTFESEIMDWGITSYLAGEWKLRGRRLELTSSNRPNASELVLRAEGFGNGLDCRLTVRDAAGEPKGLLPVQPNLSQADRADWETDWSGHLEIAGELLPLVFRVCSTAGCDEYQLSSSLIEGCELRPVPEGPGRYWDHFLARNGIFGGWILPRDSSGPRLYLHRVKGKLE
jgi:hypothetical protein